MTCGVVTRHIARSVQSWLGNTAISPEVGEIERPRMPTASAMRRERFPQMFSDLRRGPPIHRPEVLTCLTPETQLRCAPDVLDGVAVGAEGDQANEALDLALVIVFPDLVTFDGVAFAAAAADLAAHAGLLPDAPAQPCPLGRRQHPAEI